MSILSKVREMRCGWVRANGRAPKYLVLDHHSWMSLKTDPEILPFFRTGGRDPAMIMDLRVAILPPTYEETPEHIEII